MARAQHALQLMAVALLLAAAAPAAAQTGAIAGRVSDAESGAGVAAAHVRAERADGVTAAVAQSDAEGRFRLNVQAGTYSVVVSNVGYAEVRQPNVAVAAGQTAVVNISLTVTAMLLPPVVVTPERGQQGWLTTAGPIEVVPMERVEERIAIQPTDFLRGIQGIDYVQTGLMTTTVVARGFSNVFSTSLLAITDNRYMNVPSLRVNSSFLMPTVSEDIEQIEVMLGPGAALYGPNAANGVMHILTQSPLRYPGTAISVTGGERSFFGGSLRHAGQVGERFGYKLTGQYMQGREWEFIDQEEVDARAEDPSIPARDPDLSRWTAELRGDYRLTDAATLMVNLGRATAENAIEMTPFGAAQAKGWEYTYAQARLRAGRLFAQGFLNMSDAGNTFLLRTGEPIVDESRLYAAQIQHSTPVGLRQNFTYGIDIQHTNPRTGGTIHGRFEDDDDSDEIGGYILSQTRLTPQLDLQLAARYDYHSRVPDNVFSPRAALVFQPTPLQAIRATFNRAYGTPLNSQLFLDLQAGAIPGLPFQIRAIGGSPGYSFRRDCNGGVCFRSPFVHSGDGGADPAQFRPLDATPFWGHMTQVLFAASGGQIDIRGVPQPSPAAVGTVMRLLNPHPAGAFFVTVDETSLRDIAPLTPSFSNTFEVGYKGLIADRIRLSVDVWHQQRDNFVSAALVETPNVFYELTSLTVYLSNFMPPAQAQQVAAVLAGVDNQTSPLTGIPIGTVGFDHEFTQDQHVYVTYRNYGDISLWGSDLGVEAAVLPTLTLTGTYSWLSDDTFRTVGFAGEQVDVLLNAPANKGSVGLRWSPAETGLTLNSMVRFVDAFPMNSGVYVGTVESYTLVDLGATWRMPRMPGAALTVQALNVLDEQQQQFVGAPQIGRHVTARLSYRFQ